MTERDLREIVRLSNETRDQAACLDAIRDALDRLEERFALLQEHERYFDAEGGVFVCSTCGNSIPMEGKGDE